MEPVFYIFICFIILFIISFSFIFIPKFRTGPIGEAITTGGIGAVLAGSYFGIVRDTLLNKPSDPMLTMTIITMVYFWYLFTKICSTLTINGFYQMQNMIIILKRIIFLYPHWRSEMNI